MAEFSRQEALEQLAKWRQSMAGSEKLRVKDIDDKLSRLSAIADKKAQRL